MAACFLSRVIDYKNSDFLPKESLCVINLPSLCEHKILFIHCHSVSKTLRLFAMFCDFSEHIQGTRVIATKHDSEVENKAGTTETESDVQ